MNNSVSRQRWVILCRMTIILVANSHPSKPLSPCPCQLHRVFKLSSMRVLVSGQRLQLLDATMPTAPSTALSILLIHEWLSEASLCRISHGDARAVQCTQPWSADGRRPVCHVTLASILPRRYRSMTATFLPQFGNDIGIEQEGHY